MVLRKSCLNIYKIQTSEGEKKFLNHWEIRPIPVAIVNFIIISSFACYWFVFSQYLDLPNFMHILLFILNLLFLISYYMIIIESPGYLPSYYPLNIYQQKQDEKSKSLIKNDFHSLKGYAVTTEEYRYGKSKQTFGRVGMFNMTRRFVLRPDHFCGWTGSFIGKRNHKLFFLFNFWGMIYCTIFSFECIFSIVNQFNNIILSEVDLVFSLMYFVAGTFFTFFTGNFAISTVIETWKDSTQYEKHSKNSKNKNPPKRNVKKNFEAIFGPVNKWYLWLVPIPAFRGIDNEELIK